MERLDHSFSSMIEYTSRNMRRYSTGRLQQLGVTVDQWGVLRLLDESGGAVSFGDMSARLLRDKPTLTRIVDILVRDSLVTRHEDPDDRRRIRIGLTKTGAAKVRKAARVVSALRSEASRGITKRELSELHRILLKINQNIDTARTATAS